MRRVSVWRGGRWRATPADRCSMERQALFEEVNVFGFIVNHFKYERKFVDKAYRKMQKVCPGVIDRSLRILAVDYCFTSQMGQLLGVCNEDIEAYFFEKQLRFLNKSCAVKSPLVELLHDVYKLFNTQTKISFKVLKCKVMVDLKHGGPHACLALHSKHPKPLFAVGPDTVTVRSAQKRAHPCWLALTVAGA